MRAMTTCTRGALIAALGFAASAWAASPSPGDASAAPSTWPAASASATKAIAANKNSRLHKCEPMTGDEKKACKVDAVSHARAARDKLAAHHAATMK